VIRVLLAAASAVRRAGLEALIKSSPSLKLVASLQTTKAISTQLDPDVVLLDRDSPSGDMGLPLGTDIPVVILVDEPSSHSIAHALRSGVRAILPRDADVDDILSGIQAAHAGMVLLDADVTLALASRVPELSPDMLPPLNELTPRELEVLRMLAEGLGNRQMASRLGISDHTVKFHISSILDKLGASSRTEAVTLGIRAGMILL